MRLQAWDITVSHDGRPDEGTLADCHPDSQLWHARLRFADDLFGGDWDRDEQRDYIVHELIHLTHRDVTEPLRSGEWRQQLGQALYDHLYGEVARQMELTVYFLARLVAKSLPYPPWCPEPAAAESEAD
jgi:hypothetical protein